MHMIKTRIQFFLSTIAMIVLLGSCDEKRLFLAEFSDANRSWAGPEFWANRLQDWKLEDGKLVCLNETNPMRTVHILTRNLADRNGAFVSSVMINMVEMQENNASAGLLFGAGAGQDYRQAALIHHSYGKNGGLYVGISAKGKIFLRDFETENTILASSDLIQAPSGTVLLSVKAREEGDHYLLMAEALVGNQLIGRLDPVVIPSERLIGSLALVSNPDPETKKGRFAFDKWSIGGSRIEINSDRNAGPIIGTQHTLHKNKLKLTAQLMPLGFESDDNNQAWMEVKKEGRWEKIQETKIVRPGYTAHFKVEDWDDTHDQEYRIGYRLKSHNAEKDYYSTGMIRKNPRDKEELVVAAFTGNHNNVRPNPNRWGGLDTGKFPWDWGIWFPHNDMIANLKQHQPDVLFFSGDQVYEGASPTWADRQNATLDYLYKWYLWYWAFGEMTAEIPTIPIPDDHDVYHGNIWGAGGRKASPSQFGGTPQDGGGYKMPAEWVKMVERTQTAHLPDPFDSEPVEQGIGTYFTDMTYGGVSFAILEDRKFKSAPKGLLPKANVRNGWALNKDFNAKKEADAKGAILLGERQLNFLERWAGDWSEDTKMKAVLSQTIFADVVTLPSTEINDSNFPRLEIYEKDGYAPDDVPAADMDSNGWPQAGRDKAVKKLRKAFAVHIAGDQHLGSTIQYGVDSHNDAGFALCVPSIANFYPRRWFPKEEGKNRKPGAPRNTGEFEDGFGNKMTVHAVSNPYITGKVPAELHDRAAGYGIVRFNKESRDITMENWPRWSNPGEGGLPYEGWPVRLNQMDNYGKATGNLPELQISGLENPVVQVYDETAKEILYTVRISGTSFSPKVFDNSHSYSLKVGPSSDKLRDGWQGLTVTAKGPLNVSF